MSFESPEFRPRPEAQATTWAELMPPVQNAVHDLLVRIQGAHHSINTTDFDKFSDRKTKQTGNCFLVYGSRGTGKTTVLLNAQRAVCRKLGEKFFGEPEEQIARKDETKDQKNAREDAKGHAKNLRNGNLVWLEILNLEPLPSEANLLTVLLTQIRNALQSHNDKQRSERRSIFEEEADSARQRLNKLIENATLMWQNINEPDTRNLSIRQVKAADIYADFQKDFKKAMDKLVDELNDAPSSDKKLSIVLPIDNIDRSSDHLQSIVKLAQLVSHPNLWLVMAGDRVEVETFLERAYWKELIRCSNSAGAQVKRDSEGEDEALVMARRQANATAQKLWPPNHRIEIDHVKPEHTLAFEYSHHSDSTTINDIKALLGRIQIPTTGDQRKENYSSKSEKDRVTLIDLFDVKDKVDIKSKDPIFTRAAYHGLLLPARGVLDLWQLLEWLDKNEETSSTCKDFQAEKVARTMLRNALSSSHLPNGIAQKLQNGVLRRGEKGGTILSFDEDLWLEVIPLTSTNHDFEFALIPVISTLRYSEYTSRSRLIIKNIEDLTCFIKQADSPNGSLKNQFSQPFLKKRPNKIRSIELPPLVNAWLIVLYDILMLAEPESSSWVIGSPEIEWFNVFVNHTIATKAGKYKYRDVNLLWKAPPWDLFWGRNIFRLRWQNFCKNLANTFPKAQINEAQTLVPRLLAAGWIFCVLKTSVELIKSIDPQFDFQEVKIPEFEKDIQIFETDIMRAAGSFYQLIQDKKKSRLAAQQPYSSDIYEAMSITEYSIAEQQRNISASYELMVTTESPLAIQSPIIDAAYELMIVTGEWLETELINFLSFGYVPLESEVSKERRTIIWDALNKSALQEHWESNLLFILSELDKRLSAFEKKDEKKTGKNTQPESGSSENVNDTKTHKSLAELLFADLYQHLELSDR